MTLTELRYIVAVAREKHFGRAAEACFVSQPTLSVAIKKLGTANPTFEKNIAV
jgi:LysR family hydrogen peroxide-inducible transcriptional activator